MDFSTSKGTLYSFSCFAVRWWTCLSFSTADDKEFLVRPFDSLRCFFFFFFVSPSRFSLMAMESKILWFEISKRCDRERHLVRWKISRILHRSIIISLNSRIYPPFLNIDRLKFWINFQIRWKVKCIRLNRKHDICVRSKYRVEYQ